MKKIVVLTGAGISAESGLQTFRDADGLWEGYNVMDVATPEGYHKNPELVLRFYNERRSKALQAKPNAGHIALAELEKYFDVHIITQNVDNLHEKAGSSKVLHLHGELSKARSSENEALVYEIGEKDINIGDLAEDGSQLRPAIVWFGEGVPAIEDAATIAFDADIFIVVGTSLQVYPAAGLIQFVPNDSPKFIIDPKIPDIEKSKNMDFIAEKASIGMPALAEKLIKDYQ